MISFSSRSNFSCFFFNTNKESNRASTEVSPDLRSWLITYSALRVLYLKSMIFSVNYRTYSIRSYISADSYFSDFVNLASPLRIASYYWISCVSEVATWSVSCSHCLACFVFKSIMVANCSFDLWSLIFSASSCWFSKDTYFINSYKQDHVKFHLHW